MVATLLLHFPSAGWLIEHSVLIALGFIVLGFVAVWAWVIEQGRRRNL